MAFDIRNPQSQKLFLGLVAGGVLSYGYFFTDLVPFTFKAQAAEIGTLENRYRDLSKDLTKARSAINQLPYLEQESDLLHGKWEQGRVMLPEAVEMTALLRTLTIIGNQTGVEFVKFRPLQPKPATNYTENPVEISVVGGFHQVGAFLAEIANLDRVINVRGLSLETNKDKRDPLALPAQASFLAVAYTLGATAPPPPPPDMKKGSKGASAKTKPAKKPKSGGGGDE